MFPYVPQQTWVDPHAAATQNDQYVWSTPGYGTGGPSNGLLTAQGYVPTVPLQLPVQAHPGWTIPTHFVPLPPSPSMLAATMMPLPPSPRVSPRLAPVPLQPVVAAAPVAPQWYNHPIDPYYLPQGMYYQNNFTSASLKDFCFTAGAAYQNPKYTPKTRVHPLLGTDTPYLVFDLSSTVYNPHTYSQAPPTAKHGSSFFYSKHGLITVPLHQGYLEQIASHPVTNKMVIRIAAFGKFENDWKITVDPGRNILVGDILYAVYRALHKPITHEEWEKVSDHEYREASEAYISRCKDVDASVKNRGVLRVDLLGVKHYYAGISRVKDDDTHNFKMLVKGPPSK